MHCGDVIASAMLFVGVELFSGWLDAPKGSFEASRVGIGYAIGSIGVGEAAYIYVYRVSVPTAC
jgi:hypothetical protein